MEKNSNNLSAGEQKANDYADRIKKGENAGKVMEGLGSFMRDSIEKKLLQNEGSEETKQKIEERKAEDNGKIKELETKLGISKNSKLDDRENKEINLEERIEIGQQVLGELNKLSSDLHLSGGDAVIGGTWNGDFRAPGDETLEVDENKNIVLRRGARDEKALTKEGLNFTNKQELYDSSLTNGVGNGIPTASNSKIGESYTYSSSPEYMGVFRIPQNEFLILAKEGKIILGNLGESEIVISPDVALKYLSEVNGKKL